MDHAKLVKLIAAMEQTAWSLRNQVIDNNESALTIAIEDERWGMLFELLKIVSDEQYFQTIYNIYVDDEEVSDDA